MSPVNAYPSNYLAQGSPKPARPILNPYISSYLAQQGNPLPVGEMPDFKKMGQQAVPNATPPELQALRDAMLAGMIASDTAFKDAIELTGGKWINGNLVGGNTDIAFLKKAETNFDVGLKMLNATPEGRSWNQKSMLRENPFNAQYTPFKA